MTQYNILAMEYPGYGLYKDREASEANFLEDAEAVIRFAIEELRFKPEHIVVMGSSSSLRQVNRLWPRCSCLFSVSARSFGSRFSL